jgi:hypothetical protein
MASRQLVGGGVEERSLIIYITIILSLLYYISAVHLVRGEIGSRQGRGRIIYFSIISLLLFYISAVHLVSGEVGGGQAGVADGLQLREIAWFYNYCIYIIIIKI